MVRMVSALLGAILLGSCAAGEVEPARIGEAARSEIRNDEIEEGAQFDPAQTALEREISEDSREGDPATRRRGAHRIESRLAVGGNGTTENTRDSEYLAVDAGGLRCRVRRKGADDLDAVSWYGRLRIRDGLVDLHAGSFSPDLDGGLAAGGSRSASLFSSRFPLEEPRRIAANTSFYGRSLVGGAVEVRIGRVQGTILAGRERIERAGRPVVTEHRWEGGRIEGILGPLRAGAWALGGSSERRAPVFGAGVRSLTPRGSFRMEAVWRRGGAPGALAAAAFRLPSTRCGAIAYSLTSGSGGPFARIGGSALPRAWALGGAAAAIERRFSRGRAVRLAIEWRGRSDDETETTRTRLRAEAEKRWRRWRVEIVWTLAEERRGVLLPYPTGEAETRRISSSLGGVASLSPVHRVEARIAVRNLTERPGGNGFLVTSSANLTALSRKIRVSFFYSLYRASSDPPSCPVFEPSLSSSYPWRYLSPGQSRNGVVITNKINRLELSCKVASEGSERIEWSGQAKCSF